MPKTSAANDAARNVALAKIGPMVEVNPYDIDYAALAAQADQMVGADVFNKDNKGDLIGVPFIIYRLVFRNGVKHLGIQETNYVSAEAIVADAATLDDYVTRKRITPEVRKLWKGMDQIVINDSGTGICRQCVAYVVHKGFITVPDGPDGGGMLQSRFDTFRDEWTYLGEPVDVKEGGAHEKDLTISGFALNCRRGLRVSDYENSFTKDGLTYYLA